MLKYGIIKEVDNSKCLARVEFEEDEGLVSHWLQITQKQTKNVRAFSTFDVGENVVCMMDDQCERGVILGAYYDDNTSPTPTVQGEKTVGIGTDQENYATFKLGDKLILIQTDTIEAKVNNKFDLRHKNGNLQFSHDGSQFVIKSNNKELYSLLYNLLTILINHTHPTPAGPSGPPTEAPDLVTNRSDFQTFFG